MILSSRFPVVKLKDFVYFQEGPGIRNHQNTSEGIRFLNIRCFVDGRLDTESMKRVSEDEALGKYKHFLLDAGDYVVSSSGTLGRIAEVYPEDLPVMLNTSTIRFRSLDESKLDRLYLRYFLESHVFQEQVKLLATGSVQLNYGPSHLALVEMPLPTIQEQREIGKVLDTLTKGIQLNIEMSKTLEAMAQSIFKSWFVDFEPVKAKMAGMIPKGIDAASAEIFPDSMESSVSGLIPSGWRVSSLGRVLSALESGKRPKGGAQENGVPSIGAESVRGIGQFNYSATKYVPRDFYQAMPTGKVQPYDVLVYKDGAGAGSYVSMFGEGFPFEEYAINEHVFLLRSSDLPQSYLYHWLNQESIKNLMIELAQKSAQPGLNQQDTKSIPILVPSEDALVAFAGLVDPFLRAIMRNSNKNKTLQGIRDSLLPKLISGELNISEDTIAS